MESRGFAVKVGGAEITVQQASDQLATQVDDVRAQLSALKAELEPRGENGPRGAGVAAVPASPIEDGVPLLRRGLWVDDHPENNVYEREALLRRGVDVIEVKSTGEAIKALNSQQSVDAIVSDMCRDAHG